jgi:hypothetical protein
MSRWPYFLKTGFVLLWTFLCLYLSIGTVLISFSALQFQSQIATRSPSQPVTVARIRLHQKKYKDQTEEVKLLTKKAEELAILAENSNANTYELSRKIGQLSQVLRITFSIQGVNPEVIADQIKIKCSSSGLDDATREQCSSFIAAHNSSGTSTFNERSSAQVFSVHQSWPRSVQM